LSVDCLASGIRKRFILAKKLGCRVFLLFNPIKV
jgi:hypothetical protein